MENAGTALNVEVCLTPKLFPEVQTGEERIVVLADILRATTSICAAFQNGVASILPVADADEAKALKEAGYLVASEQDGRKHDFADFGNSAFHFTREAIGGKSLVYCTTNGTRALALASGSGEIAIGAFINLGALAQWLCRQGKNVVVLCSGWKNRFCLEDTLFAGALTERLLRSEPFITGCDSAYAALDLWSIASADPVGYLGKAAHRQRLRRLGLDDVLAFSLTIDVTDVVPVYRNGLITNVNHQPNI